MDDRAGELVEIDGRAFIKTKPGMMGHAVHGPCETLEPGKYKVEFRVKPLGEPTDERDPLCAIAEIEAGSDRVIVKTLMFRSDFVKNHRFVVYFEAEEVLSNVEYRLYVNGVEPILLGDAPSAVKVEWSELSPRPNALPKFLQDQMDRVRALFFAGVGIAALREEIVVTVGVSQFHLRTLDDLDLADELISKNDFSIMYPLPVCLPTEAAGRHERDAQIIVLATYTPFGHFGFSLVGYVMDEVYGAHRRIHCGSVAELRARWSERKGTPVLITSDRPDAVLSYLLTTSGFPILAFFDDPFAAITYPVFYNGFSLPDSMRFCTQQFSCLGGCAGSERVLIFDSSRYDARVADTVEAICAAIGLEPRASLTERVVERVVTHLGLAADATMQDVVRRGMNEVTLWELASQRFDASERALIDWFVAEYGPVLMGRERDIKWPREFLWVGPNGETAERIVELLGKARHIVWGPYMHLPIGGWRARVEFEVVDNVSGNKIEADVWMPLAQKQIAKRIAKLPVQGYFQITLEFVNVDPNGPLEIRIRLIQGAIEGRFVLSRVMLERVARLGDLVTNTSTDPVLHELLT